MLSHIAEKVKNELSGDCSGHDWWHIDRVRKNAALIQRTEGGDAEIIEMSALVHDIGDHKFLKEGETQEEVLRSFLAEFDLPEKTLEEVIQIVSETSYKGADIKTPCSSIESKVVQDADRLDAIGAVGIARTFAYGGSRDRLMYNPEQPPAEYGDFKSYSNNKSHTINHFYEKLLLLKDRMQTETGREMAEKRTVYMQDFIAQFMNEWEGMC